MISEAALQDLRDRNPVTDLAGRWVSLRRGQRGGMVGPCPLHSPDPSARDSTSFECWPDRWVCATCQDGGDVIKLVMLRESMDFRSAVAWLGGAQEIDPAEAARREAEAKAKRAKAEAASAYFREQERERLHAFWRAASPVVGTPVEAYLALRGLTAPPGARLRAHPHMPYFVPRSRAGGGRAPWQRIHTGPAMLAAIIGPDGRFSGLHITWIDLAQPKGKVVLADPETGEILPSKKVRGTKNGGHVELVRCANPHRLIIGEGIETVLSPYAAMLATGRSLDGTAFWSSADLGNLAGAAAKDCRVPHPTAKDRAGRAMRIPGAEPDFASEAVVIPESVVDLRLLGDGDSDPFATHLAMERARARHAREGRRISIPWPDNGKDFNSMLVA